MKVHDFRDLDLSFLKPKEEVAPGDIKINRGERCPCDCIHEDCVHPLCPEGDCE